MEYTVQKLGQLAGVSTRTLRYYDEIGILKPARINSSGYRIYGEVEVDRLQQILFYRELGVNLEEIGEILNNPDFNGLNALKEHYRNLLMKQKQLEQLIKNVEKTIGLKEGRNQMSNHEKFDGFKKRMIEDNESKYGTEIREKYGENIVNASYQKFGSMTEEQYAGFEKLGEELMNSLEAAFQTGNSAGEEAMRVAELHKEWLMYTWRSYSREAHAGLARMYVEDERFTAYYDKRQPGLALFLRDAILNYTRMM